MNQSIQAKCELIACVCVCVCMHMRMYVCVCVCVCACAPRGGRGLPGTEAQHERGEDVRLEHLVVEVEGVPDRVRARVAFEVNAV